MLEVRLKERDEKLIESQTLASSRDQHIEDLKAKLQVAREKIEHFTSENKRLSHTSDSLEKEKNDLTNQLQIAQKQAETFEKRVKELEIELSNAKEQITQLSESNTKNEETIAQMSDKLVRLKGEMSIVKLQLRKFNVRRVRSYLPSVEAVLVLHKNPQNGLLMFSMEVGGVPHLVVPMTAILDVQADEVHVKRFHIRFPNNKTETFESNELKEIMTTLKEFQGAAIDENGVHTPVGTTSSPTKSFRLRNARK
jgi:predicted RNase H-like nuclease (RuvC/YqgF family)